MRAFELYKPKQGKNIRWASFGAGMLLVAIGAYWLSEELRTVGNVYVQYFVPLVVALALAFVLFRLVNREQMAEFLIATEGEMKKVAWSSKKEVIGSTKVVVFATITLAVMLFVVDNLFKQFFEAIGVLRFQGPA